jgi:hypothetical protein
LFALGVVELIKNIKFSLKYYTFEDDSINSLLQSQEVPDKPFTREAALWFLVVGYLASIGLGLAIRYLMGSAGDTDGAWRMVVSLLLLPPVFVFLVAKVRSLRIFEISKIQIR